MNFVIFRKVIIAVLCSMAFSLSVYAQDYWRVVGPNQIKNMNSFERVQFNKANELLNKGQFKAAATEFEKYKVQFKDSDALPYIIFLGAYSLHQSKDRNAAIEAYNEVIDIFGREITPASAALYYRGVAQMDNGDTSKGIQSMKELVQNDLYKKTPPAADALLIIAQASIAGKEYDKAVGYWKQLIRDFMLTATRSADASMSRLAVFYFVNNDLKSYENFYSEYATLASKLPHNQNKKKDPALQTVNMVKLAYSSVNPSSHDLAQYSRNGKIPDLYLSIWNYLISKKSSFEQADALAYFYSEGTRLLFAKKGLVKASEQDKFFADYMSFIQKLQEKDKKAGQKLLQDLISFMITNGEYDRARYFNSKIENKQDADWNEYSIIKKQGKWTECVKMLDTIRTGDKATADFNTKCLWEKASILANNLKNYDDAIKIYQELSQPPKTLWEIQNCYYRKGDMKNAIAILNEIEASFSNDAPDAAWRRSTYYTQNKQPDLAVKEARAILKKYPKSAASSQAQQFLKKIDVAPGGGVAD